MIIIISLPTRSIYKVFCANTTKQKIKLKKKKEINEKLVEFSTLVNRREGISSKIEEYKNANAFMVIRTYKKLYIYVIPTSLPML